MKRKKLSLHVNREIEASNPRGDRNSHEPGVYEEEIHPPGEHWYKIVMPSGTVGIVYLPDELWDEDVCPNLWKLFYRKGQTQFAPRVVR